MTPVLQSHFADYAAFHRTPGNQACHYIGIPLIVLSLFAMLAAVPLASIGGFQLTLAELMLLLTSVYYLRLDASLAALMIVASILADVAGRRIPMPIAIGLFVFGWVMQFIGHYVYEHRAPAFYRNLTHLLVGPLWILAKATRRA
jgi:uncharacterized membrane protein YGL010W